MGLPSRCMLGESVCQGTCHAIGRAHGVCDKYGCTCSDRFLTPSEFLLCAAESEHIVRPMEKQQVCALGGRVSASPRMQRPRWLWSSSWRTLKNKLLNQEDIRKLFINSCL